jgi:hypothetical protein
LGGGAGGCDDIRLYDKNSESDFFFFPATLGIRIFFLEKNHNPSEFLSYNLMSSQPPAPPPKHTHSLEIIWSYLPYNNKI